MWMKPNILPPWVSYRCPLWVSILEKKLPCFKGPHSQIAKILGSTSIRHRCLIDIDPRVFTIRGVVIDHNLIFGLLWTNIWVCVTMASAPHASMPGWCLRADCGAASLDHQLRRLMPNWGALWLLRGRGNWLVAKNWCSYCKGDIFDDVVILFIFIIVFFPFMFVLAFCTNWCETDGSKAFMQDCVHSIADELLQSYIKGILPKGLYPWYAKPSIHCGPIMIGWIMCKILTIDTKLLTHKVELWGGIYQFLF